MPYQHTFTELEQIAAYAEASGLFSGGQKLSKSQAMMRLLRGKEIGLPPTTALGGIWFSRGKLICDAATTAFLLSQAGYEIEATETTNTQCGMKLLRDGKAISPVTTFTLEEARKAGLVKGGGAWESWPSDMLWARCLTRLARRYAAHVFGGSIYAPGEIPGEGEHEAEPVAVPQMLSSTPPPAAASKPIDSALAAALDALKLIACEKLGMPKEQLRTEVLSFANVSRLDQLAPEQVTLFAQQRFEGQWALCNEIGLENPTLRSLWAQHGNGAAIPWGDLVALVPQQAPPEKRQDGDAAANELFGLTTGLVKPDEQTKEDDIPY